MADKEEPFAREPGFPRLHPPPGEVREIVLGCAQRLAGALEGHPCLLRGAYGRTFGRLGGIGFSLIAPGLGRCARVK